MSALQVPSWAPLLPSDVYEVEYRSYWQISFSRFRSNPSGLVALGVLVFMVLIAFGAPLIQAVVTHVDPYTQDLSNLFSPPSRLHLLGTDELGRDEMTRLAYGAQVSLTVGFLTAAFTLTIGVTVGIIAGYFGALIDEVLMRLVDSILAMPAIFLFMLMAIVFRPEPVTLSLMIASVSWGATARLVRAETLALKTNQHVLAARSIGATNFRIIAQHVLPHTLPTVIVAGSLSVGYVVLIEAALDFLGLGIQPPTPTWGNMLTNAQSYLFQSIWLMIFPGALILATVASLNVLGNALRDALDPRSWRR
jgi:peptide/nickel transport system permease protein